MRYEIVAEAYRDLEGTTACLALIDRLARLVRQTPTELLATVVLLRQGEIAPDFARSGARRDRAAGRPGGRRAAQLTPRLAGLPAVVAAAVLG